MLNEIDAKQELRDRLSENLLEDADDLMEFVQDSSRLAALGDDSGINRLPELFSRPAFAGNLLNIFDNRCKQGIWDAEEYSGEELALSLIEAQDFYCFQQRFKPLLETLIYAPEIGGTRTAMHTFEAWWEACEDAELDEDAAEMIRDFLKVFPIPEEERLPVINTPTTDWEYALLDAVYAGVELPLIPLILRPLSLKDAARARLYDEENEKFTKRSTTFLAAADDDGKPSKTQKLFAETIGKIESKKAGFAHAICVQKQLDDDWNIRIFITDENEQAIPVDRVRIASVPAFRDESDTTCWNCLLKPFSRDMQNKLLESPITIQLTNGYKVECSQSFSH